jgi:hypothetical protein
MPCNLSQLAKAMKVSRQRVNQLAREPDAPYLAKPGEKGATRWQVDPRQVMRWLEGRDQRAAEERERSQQYALEEAYSRAFWRECLRRGWRPDEISMMRDKCGTIEQLRLRAKRLGINL